MHLEIKIVSKCHQLLFLQTAVQRMCFLNASTGCFSIFWCSTQKNKCTLSFSQARQAVHPITGSPLWLSSKGNIIQYPGHTFSVVYTILYFIFVLMTSQFPKLSRNLQNYLREPSTRSLHCFLNMSVISDV